MQNGATVPRMLTWTGFSLHASIKNRLQQHHTVWSNTGHRLWPGHRSGSRALHVVFVYCAGACIMDDYLCQG